MKIYTDAGSRGNPGKSAGAIIIVKDNKIIKEKSKFFGIKTNNEAEYNAIIFALEEVKEKNQDIEIFSDSELVVNQLSGKYKITKPHLQELYDKVQKLTENKKVKFSHKNRENKFITRADELVNEELDKH